MAIFPSVPSSAPITTNVTANYTVQRDDSFLLVSNTASLVITLPPTTAQAGRVIVVDNELNSNTVAVNVASSSDSINGSTTGYTLAANKSIGVRSDGAGFWRLICAPGTF